MLLVSVCLLRVSDLQAAWHAFPFTSLWLSGLSVELDPLRPSSHAVEGVTGSKTCKNPNKQGWEARPCRWGMPAGAQSNAEAFSGSKTDTSHPFRAETERVLLKRRCEKERLNNDF